MDLYETNGSSPPVRARNYTEARQHLAALRNFKHSTLSGAWENNRYSDGRPAFVVKSYATPVAAYTPADETHHADIWTTTTRYSATTSKHMGVIAFGWRYLLADDTANLYGRLRAYLGVRRPGGGHHSADLVQVYGGHTEPTLKRGKHASGDAA